MQNENQIPERVLAAAGRSLNFQMLSLLNQVLADTGISNSLLSKRLGWSKSKVKKTITGARKMTIDEVGQIFFAIDGSMISLRLVQKNDAAPTVQEETNTQVPAEQRNDPDAAGRELPQGGEESPPVE